jgi:PBSX family phage terminase large subunit
MEFQPFSPKQKTVMTWWRDPALMERDGILCDGAVRSGKTISMAVGFLLWSMTRFEGQTFALCGRSVESLRRNVTNQLPTWMEPIFRFEERRSENRLTVYSGSRKNDYYLFGGHDERSYAAIQGITLAGVLLDEVVLMPRSFVEQALARCSVAGSKFWFNCNPAGPGHWFYQEWVLQERQRNLLYLHFTMEDNPALSAAVRARYQRLYTGAFYDRYILGLWRVAEGAIYDRFDPQKHLLRELPELTGECYVSVDYGTQNPTVFLRWQRAQQGAWVCTGEYYWSGRAEQCQKTDGEYADDLAQFTQGCAVRAVIVDPSAASFIAELRRRGWRVLGADNRVVDGIRAVGELLKDGGLLFSDQCVHTAEEFRSYVWDEHAAARGEDRPCKENDHCMDALRYFVTTVVRRARVRVGKRPAGL